MAHGLNSMIKREIDCNNKCLKSQSPQSAISQTSVLTNTSVNLSSSVQQSCGNAKMGSRRIFTPQFKLQVLESYRNDSDCKGNQRATARKYGIHRRQIQKWLQCESNLRSSVANLNQSSIKHQFHNISHQMPGATSGTHTNSNNNQHQQQYKVSVLSLDTARHNVALTPMTLSVPQTSAPSVAAVSSIARQPTTKCVNGSNNNTPNTIKSATSTVASVQPPYRISMPVLDTDVLTHTPAISSLPLISHYHHNHQRQHESRLLMPSASLPVPGSPVSAATNRTDELRDYQPISMTENCYMNEDYRCPPKYESLNYFNSPDGVAPIDLSLHLKRREFDYNSENRVYIKLEGTNSTELVDNNETSNRDKCEENKDLLVNRDLYSHAVDLTCRKRKNVNINEASPEKVQKTCNDEESDAVAFARGTGKNGDHQQQQAKPVKLFKPYLLDENDGSSKLNKCEQRDPIIWSHHPTCVTPGGYESQSSNAGSNFPSSPNERYSFPAGSPTFQTHATYDRTTTATPASPQTATTRIYWCPKSSPVSGYDSASTYSDCSEYYQSPSNHFQTYSLNLKMQAIDSYYHDLTCRGDQLAVAGKYNVHTSEVQRWLDQETNIRQGIALYV